MLKTLRKVDYHKEQIEAITKSKLSTFGGGVVVPFTFLFIYKDFIPIWILYPWTIAQLLIFTIRIIIGNKILKILYSSKKKIIDKNLKIYLYAIFAYSLLWGLASIPVLLYTDELHIYIFFIMVLGLSAAAVLSLGPIFHAVFSFISIVMSITIFSLIVIGATSTYYLLAFFGIAYLLFVLPASFKSFTYMSKHLKTKKELIEKNKNFQNLLDATMEAIILVDENYMIEDINQSSLHLFDIQNKAEVIGQSFVKFLPNQTVSTLYEYMSQTIKTPCELNLKKHNKELFPALIRLKDSSSHGRKVKIITILDLTKIKEKDQQLLQQSRLAQMGEMISMIAHQWRQPLNAISLTSNNLQLKLIMENVDYEYFQKEIALIDNYSQHLSKTIDDFRGFFKDDKVKEKTTLTKIVEDTLSIIKISAENKNIKIITDFNCDEELETYTSEVKQVLLNIIKNAEDALIENKIGTPTITIQTKYDKPMNIKKLFIKDNAGGIPADVVGKIFDPYFSTKLEKDGTGLGLYMSKTIIEDHCGGKLSVKNNKQGAIFKIQL